MSALVVAATEASDTEVAGEEAEEEGVAEVEVEVATTAAATTVLQPMTTLIPR